MSHVNLLYICMLHSLTCGLSKPPCSIFLPVFTEVEDVDPFLYADDVDILSSQYSDHSQHQRLKRSSSSSSGNHRGSMYSNTHKSNNTTSEAVETEEKGGRSVETIVVVDNAMLTTHGQSNVTTYVLTLLNMVSTVNNCGTSVI